MGIKDEAHLNSAQFNWLGSIYYAGYMVGVPIHNRMFQVFPVSKYIAACVCIWGELDIPDGSDIVHANHQ